MPIYCTVCLNNTRKNKNVSYFTYPKDSTRRLKWLKAVGREDLLTKIVDDKTRQQYRICEDHFERPCIKFSKNKTIKYLFDNAFPTLNLLSKQRACSSQCSTTQAIQNIQSMPIPEISSSPNNIFNKIDVWKVIASNSIQIDSENEKRACESRWTQTPLHLLGNPRRMKQALDLQEAETAKSCNLNMPTDADDQDDDDQMQIDLQDHLNSDEDALLQPRVYREQEEIVTSRVIQKVIQPTKSSQPHFTNPSEPSSSEKASIILKYKKQIKKYRKLIKYKNRQLKHLNKQNKILMKANATLEELVTELKKKRINEESMYQSVDGEPGFTAETLTILAEKAQLSPVPLLCSLIIGEMSTKQQAVWTGTEYEGFLNMGAGIESEQKASKALVFLIVSLTEEWTFPLAYFFTQSLTGEMKMHLITIALQKCQKIGIQIVSVTFDGSQSDLNCIEALGCNLRDHRNMKTTFRHPTGDHEIAIFIDPSHMIKLMRNQLESKKEFFDGNSGLIKWSLIEALRDLKENSFDLSTRLPHRQSYFRNQIMKVKSTPLLNNDVANGITFCDKELKIDKFANSDATVNFIKMLNNLFDVFNSKKITDDDVFKKPLSTENSSEVLTFCTEAKKYLTALFFKVKTKRTLTVKGEDHKVIEVHKLPLYRCNGNIGIIGLLTCINSLEYLYMTLIESGDLDNLMTYKCSRDNSDLLFDKIRTLGGFKNNPNALQFKTAYKKILMEFIK